MNNNYISLLAIFLLIVILSQSRTFNLLFDTYLGRIILVLFILVISYTNKILGIVSVLLIVIMFNNSLENINYFESFTNNITEKDSNPKKDPNLKKDLNPNPTQTQTQPNNLIAQEGFDLIGKEDVMRKSKQSNTVPVNNLSRSSDNAEPFTGLFAIPYSAF
jgi:hypothetical protein